MSEKQNIDRLFQEKFKDFEVPPSPKVWKEIEAKLKDEKDDRKMLPLWFRFAGIAAALFIGLLVTDIISFSTDGNDATNSVVIEQNPSVNGTRSNSPDGPESTGQNAVNPENGGNQDQVMDAVKEKGYETGIASEKSNQKSDMSRTNTSDKPTKVLVLPTNGNQQNNKQVKNQNGNPDVNNAIASTGKQKAKKAGSANRHKSKESTSNIGTETDEGVASISQTTTKKEVVAKSDLTQPSKTLESDNVESKDLNITQQNKAVDNKIAALTSDDIKTDTTAVATVVPNTLEELLKEKENKLVTVDEPKLNRWQISTNVAPIYFSSTSNGSPIDARLAQSSKEYKADLAYGVGVRYSLNKKFTVRAGVNTVGMEYHTNDLAFVQTTNARALKNVEPNIQGTLIQIEARPLAGPNTLISNDIDSGRKFSSSLTQRTGYIEVPLEMSYKLVDKRFAIEVIGGFSTLFLNENSVSLVASGLQMEIGKANNLNDTHFSTNVGVGLRYNFLRNFQFNVEPMFKYQINTFSDSSNFNPYMFGLYTGLNYRF